MLKLTSARSSARSSVRSTTSARLRIALAVALAGGAVSTTLHAEPPAPDGSALKGPSVSDRKVPGVQGAFGTADEVKRKQQFVDRIPPKVFREALEPLVSPDADPAIAVDAEKRERFVSMVQDFEKSVRAYMDQHKAEIKELGGKGAGGAPGRPGKRPEAGQPPEGAMQPEGDDASMQSARDRLREIMEGAPKIEDVYTKVWAELTPAQREIVDHRLDAYRQERSKERQENYVRQKTGKKAAGAEKARADEQAKTDGAPPAPAGPSASPFGGRPERSDRPEGAGSPPPPGDRRGRLMALWERLSPQQQDELLRRLEQRLQEGQNAPQPRRNRGPGGNTPPAPQSPPPNPPKD